MQSSIDLHVRLVGKLPEVALIIRAITYSVTLNADSKAAAITLHGTHTFGEKN